MSTNGIIELVDKRSALVIDFVLIDAYFYQGRTLFFWQVTTHCCSVREIYVKMIQVGVVLRRCPMLKVRTRSASIGKCLQGCQQSTGAAVSAQHVSWQIPEGMWRSNQLYSSLVIRCWPSYMNLCQVTYLCYIWIWFLPVRPPARPVMLQNTPHFRVQEAVGKCHSKSWIMNILNPEKWIF